MVFCIRLKRSTAGHVGFTPGVEPGGRDDDGTFRPLRKPPLGSGSGGQILYYYAPSTVSSIKTLAGSIELLIPTKAPGSIVTAGFARDVGKPLNDDALKAAGVEITLQGPTAGNTNQLPYMIKDPKKRVGAVEFFDAVGKKLESNGSFSAGDDSSQTRGVTFNSRVPADAVAKIYVITDQAVVTVPFEFKDIPIPQQ